MAKGSVIDLFLIGFVFIFAAAVIIPLIFFMLESIKSNTTNDMINSTYLDSGIMGLKTIDAGFMFITIGIALASVLAAFLIQTHPAYYFVTLILSVIVIYLSSIFSNIHATIAAQATTTSAYAEFGISNLVMTNLPIILVVFSIMIALAMYSRGRI